MSLNETQQQLMLLMEEYQAKEQLLLDGLTKEQRIEVGFPIKDIHRLDEFKANGVEYVIRTSLTISRFEEFEALQIEVGYGVAFREMFNNVRKAYDHLNAQKVADASVVLYNIMHGIKNNLEGRENEVLMLCSLFICRKGEDVSTYDEQLCKAKIEDWKKEGINMDSFFTLAFGFVNSFTPVYEQASQSISEHLENVKGEIKKLRHPKNTSTGAKTK